MSRRALAWGVGAWVLAIAGGMGLLLQYSFTPGSPARAPTRWPADSHLERATDKPTLVLAAHPHCPCTRASISELSYIMTRLAGRARAYVLFVEPEGFGEDWARTDLWTSASIIEGVTVVLDPRGREMARFGAMTSGQAYLYGGDGRLLFRGGITPTRSHQGDNVGRRRIISLVTEGASDRDVSAVYGCPLDDEEADAFWLSDLRPREWLR